jgi:hypothetical protein
MNRFNFLYIKTPKTASELIKRYLRLYGDAAELKRNPNALGGFYEMDFFEYSCEHIMMLPKVLKHFFTKNNRQLDSLILTSVRNPLDRMFSHYYFSNIYKNQMDFNEWYLNYHNNTLRGIHFGWEPNNNLGHFEPQYDNLDNYQLQYLGLMNPKNIFVLYDYVFITEKVEEQFNDFEKIVDYKFNRYQGEKKINNNINYPDEIIISEEVKNIFMERNQKDYELYDYVNKHYFN